MRNKKFDKLKNNKKTDKTKGVTPQERGFHLGCNEGVLEHACCFTPV